MVVIINGERLPELDLDQYSISYHDVLRDSSGELESGRQQRDIARKEVCTASLEFVVTKQWISKLRAYRNQDSLQVKLLEPELEENERKMFMESFDYTLSYPTSYGGVWKVKIALTEY